MLRQLRQANKERNKVWDAQGKLSLMFKALEMAGEVGEACNVVKKLEREKLGISGSRDTLEHLAEELADVFITADLVAMAAGIDAEDAIVKKFNATSQKLNLPVKLRKDNNFFDFRLALFNMGVLYSSIGQEKGYVIKFAGLALSFDSEGKLSSIRPNAYESMEDVKRSYNQRSLTFKEWKEPVNQTQHLIAENGDVWVFYDTGTLKEFHRG